MTDIIDRLRIGIDNADAGADGIRELGGVVLTMNEAADEIEKLRDALDCMMVRLLAEIEPRRVKQKNKINTIERNDK